LNKIQVIELCYRFFIQATQRREGEENKCFIIVPEKFYDIIYNKPVAFPYLIFNGVTVTLIRLKTNYFFAVWIKE